MKSLLKEHNTKLTKENNERNNIFIEYMEYNVNEYVNTEVTYGTRWGGKKEEWNIFRVIK